MKYALTAFTLTILLVACASGVPDETTVPGNGTSPAVENMNRLVEPYVKLVLGVGEHDEGYVDAYYGPEAWQEEVTAAPPSLEALAATADSLSAQVNDIDVADEADLVQLRQEFFDKQLTAVRARIEMLQGQTFSFDEESRVLYDAEAPHHEPADFQPILDSLELMLPGDAPLVDRVAAFRNDFIIPPARLDTVFQAAIAEARARTAAHITLPEGENFVLEFVTDQPWSGYNWYQGDGHSLIQINTDLPIYIDRAIDLAAHEGYPGHHLYNALLEQHLVRDRGWMEFSVYPLYSPQSLIAEGSASFAQYVAFPGEDRVEFSREVLFPLAGLDTSRVEAYFRVLDLLEQLDYAGNEAARRYLNGTFDAEEAANWLVTYALSEPDRAAQRVRFFEQKDKSGALVSRAVVIVLDCVGQSTRFAHQR